MKATVIDGLQKVANRITLGLVLASLIISAAMMMRIESRFTALGYPGCELGRKNPLIRRPQRLRPTQNSVRHRQANRSEICQKFLSISIP